MQDAFKVLSPHAGMECVWQTDGRPMSGDVGRGMSHASVAFAQRALEVYVCIYVYAFLYVDVYVYVYAYVYLYVCMYVYMCVCVLQFNAYMHVHTQLCTHTHTHTHTCSRPSKPLGSEGMCNSPAEQTILLQSWYECV